MQVETYIVIATCRNLSSADALNSLKSIAGSRLHVVRLDVADEASILSAAKDTETILGEIGLDYLINNAAIVCARMSLPE